MLDELKRFELYKQLNPDELSTQQFLRLKHEIKSPKKTTISDEYLDFKLWYNGCPSRQNFFYQFIFKKLAKKEGASILEVGCGRTAKLSRSLSKKGFKMTCIDPKLEISNCGDIEFIKSHFHYKKFDLTKYDYIIAQEPCEATEHIVRACTNQNKPFLITLCGVPHKLISGQIPKDVFEWYDYLVNISIDNVKLRYLNLIPFYTTPILKSNKF